MRIRPFEEGDYARIAAIAAVAEPERGRGVEWFWYHPRKFRLRVYVDPDFQQRGVGSAIYAQLMQHTQANWRPLRINAEVHETHAQSAAFFEHRGFHQVATRWEATLSLLTAPVERMHAAMQHVSSQGLQIVNMQEVRLRRGDAAFTRAIYDLEQLAYLDEPGYDPGSALQYEQFVANELVALSRMERDSASADRIHIGCTGTHPEYRGRGLAVALKLCTIQKNFPG